MANLPDLAKLHDIHLPPPVGWWPLAPGWILLIIFTVVIIGVMVGFTYRHFLHARPKRHACKLLASYEQAYQRDGNAAVTCTKISELLRRVALAYFPRADVASLKGDAWINFLNQTSKNINFNAVRHCLLEVPYQNQADKINLNPLFTRAHAWIKQRGIPCLN